ncbi:unnamed protein product [Owenia fusiformis]|uniref:Uncharacterized protein n=1 Tax=Owenia fusiformis TaxID=6347 RepID=A0A8J1XI20_OWEFU|nr:unnamed protein product [Owenia fusiformis]
MKAKLWKLVLVGLLVICGITAYGAAQMVPTSNPGLVSEGTPTVSSQGKEENATRYTGEHTIVGNPLDPYVPALYVGNNEENNYIIVLDNNVFGDGVMTSFAARFINTNPVTVMVVRPESGSSKNFEIIHSFVFTPKNLTEYGTIQGITLTDCPLVQEGDRLAFTNLNGGDGGGPVTYIGDMRYMFKWLRYEYSPTQQTPGIGDTINTSRMIHQNRFFAMATYAPEVLCGENVEPDIVTTTKRPTTTTTTTEAPIATTTSQSAAENTTTPVATRTTTETTTTAELDSNVTTTHNSPLTTPTQVPSPVVPTMSPDPGPDGGGDNGQCTVISNLNVKCESSLSNPNGQSSDKPWEIPARDCTEVLAKGATESGPYFIRPYFGSTVSPVTIQVYCHFEDGKAWTTVLRRLDGAIDFSECKLDGGCLEEGTGHYSYEYWIGLNKLHILTQDKPYKLRVSMETFSGSRVFAEYSVFWLNNYANYRLHVGGHSGVAGDSLGLHNRFRFTSACRDVAGQVGWIEKADGSCETHANLFGPYSSECGENNECIFWDTIPLDPNGNNRAIKTLEVKITPS